MPPSWGSGQPGAWWAAPSLCPVGWALGAASAWRPQSQPFRPAQLLRVPVQGASSPAPHCRFCHLLPSSSPQGPSTGFLPLPTVARCCVKAVAVTTTTSLLKTLPHPPSLSEPCGRAPAPALCPWPHRLLGCSPGPHWAPLKGHLLREALPDCIFKAPFVTVALEPLT